MYNLFHVGYFVDAAHAGSLAAVARKHRVSQSAVSQAIRSLETAFGLALCHHERKSFRLTDDGKAMLRTCEEMLKAAAAVREQAQELQGGYGGVLHIASTNSLATTFLPPQVRALSNDYPQVRVTLRLANSEVLKTWLTTGEADVGVLVDDGKLRDALVCETIGTGRYVLCKRRTGAEDIFSEGLVVTRRERPEVQHVLRTLRERHGKAPPIRCEIISWEAIKNYVASAGGYGILPDYAMGSPAQGRGLCRAKVPFTMPAYELVAATAKRHGPSKNARLFLQVLRRAASP